MSLDTERSSAKARRKRPWRIAEKDFPPGAAARSTSVSPGGRSSGRACDATSDGEVAGGEEGGPERVSRDDRQGERRERRGLGRHALGGERGGERIAIRLARVRQQIDTRGGVVGIENPACRRLAEAVEPAGDEELGVRELASEATSSPGCALGAGPLSPGARGDDRRRLRRTALTRPAAPLPPVLWRARRPRPRPRRRERGPGGGSGRARPPGSRATRASAATAARGKRRQARRRVARLRRTPSTSSRRRWPSSGERSRDFSASSARRAAAALEDFPQDLDGPDARGGSGTHQEPWALTAGPKRPGSLTPSAKSAPLTALRPAR